MSTTTTVLDEQTLLARVQAPEGEGREILDAATREVVKTGYLEDKMEVGNSSAKFLGISHTEKNGMTIDSMVHLLVQKCVVEIDKVKGHPSALAASAVSPSPASTVDLAEQTLVTADATTGNDQERRPTKRHGPARELPIEASPNCQELRKTWQLGDASVMQRYLQECAK